MNFSQWIELTHPVALLMLCTAAGLLLIIVLLANTVISAMDVYRDKHLNNNNSQLTKGLLAMGIIPGLPNDMFATLASVLILEVLVILALLAILHFLTGIRVSRKAWVTTSILFAVLGYGLVFAAGKQASRQPVVAEAAAPAPETAIDPNNVPQLTEEADIKAGKAIFSGKCGVCHGGQGQGLVGPKLTDDTWLHGGSVNEIFKTIKEGVPAKGMQAWGKSLSDKQIAQVTGFILSIKGS